jgi:large subunit ribosomal protein LP1
VKALEGKEIKELLSYIDPGGNLNNGASAVIASNTASTTDSEGHVDEIQDGHDSEDECFCLFF